jgi:MFS family permease
MITPPRVAVRRLALGRLISLTGTFAAGTALAFSIYQRTGSAAWVAATMVFTWGLIGLLGPIAGAIGDRFDRRHVMIWCDIGAGGCWALMALFEEPVALVAIAFFASAIEAPFFPASSAAIPNVAGRENISWANSLVAMGSNAGLTLGPLIGGILVATVDARLAFLANAVSFGVSAMLVASVRGNFADPERSALDEEEHRGLVAGFRFVRRDRVLRTLLMSWFAFIIGMATTIVADPVLAEEFGTGSLGYGLISAFWGGGTILGAFLARRMTEEKEGWYLVVFSGFLALTGFGVALAPWFWLVLVWVLLFGIADGPTQVAEQNLLQRRAPDVVRSRVMGAWDAVHHVAMVIALVLGGVIVPVLGPRGAYVVGGVTGLIGTAMLLPLLRWLPDRTTTLEARPGEPPAVEPLVPGAVEPVSVPGEPSSPQA